ncbi:MAG: multicopper oxidase domain-containing protein [Chloroflexi bacterium]|nr:multicopper oxidase domain-containing protein [Chloroflexota bacterium]
MNRRQFLLWTAATGAAFWVRWKLDLHGTPQVWAAPLPGGTLDPTTIAKYAAPMVIPPAMPRASALTAGGESVDYYEIAVRQFQQQILPPGLPPTTVWSYGAVQAPGTVGEGGSFNYPAFTIEAVQGRPLRVKWINDLVDGEGRYLPHLLPVDQTLHWANPPGGMHHRDHHGMDPMSYTGPVPIVTHVHGAHTHEESDGYAEAWYLPDASNIPQGYAEVGTWYEPFKARFATRTGEAWERGSATYQYPNDQRATTLWYHDHSLGMTRCNVYAGPAGFYLIRGGADDQVLDAQTGEPAELPGPAPALGDQPGTKYYEIPIAIQDRAFNSDGSLYYPDNRAFFEGLDPSQLQIPFIPERACDGERSDVSPIWNPEFFGNVMVVNGVAWPHLDVEQRRYRLRLLNGCNSRFLILKLDHPDVALWQIGAEGGFLAAPVEMNSANGGRLLLAPAERADVIVDFGAAPVGATITLLNLGPDEPFGGGEPGVDFDPSDPATTGQVMQFRVVEAAGPDTSTPPERLVLPAIDALAAGRTRQVTLNEEESRTVRVVTHGDDVVMDCDDPEAVPFGPTSALLGTLDSEGMSTPLKWMEEISETPAEGDTETWEIYNFTMDAHPIHIHLVQFQVAGRASLVTDMEGMAMQPAELIPGTERPPEAWELGYKDTVIAYPGEVTRVIARFDLAGLYVWHCHIVEHEDNEMMRPYRVLNKPIHLPRVMSGG